MLRRVYLTMMERDLVRPGIRVVAGVSGGADSMAMLHALWFLHSRLRIDLAVAHLHHGLRGRSADRDHDLVAARCAELGLPFFAERVVLETDRPSGESIEMAARSARHAFFERVATQWGGAVVALAHTRDDQAETILMRMAAGTGLDGLAGMDYRSEPAPGLVVVRPMLDVSRAEVVAFLRHYRLAWREDATNRDRRHVRNRMRHDVLPAFARAGYPDVAVALARLAEVAREENRVMAGLTAHWRARCVGSGKPGVLNASALRALPVAGQRRVLRVWLNDAGVGGRATDFSRIERLRRGLLRGGTWTWNIDAGRAVVIKGGRCRIVSVRRYAPGDPGHPATVLAVPGVTDIPHMGWRVRITSATGFRRPREAVGELPSTVYLRRAPGAPPRLELRTRRPGDMIAPTGMTGRIKVKELLVNAKVPLPLRNQVPVLVADGRPVWVAGHRVDRHWAVEGPDTPAWRVVIERRRE